MYGADAAELDRLAAEFRRTADELDGEGGALTGILRRVSWLGDVATHYMGEWTGVQIPRIGLSTEFLRGAADNLHRQAEEQRQASGGSRGGHSGSVRRSGGGGGGGGGGGWGTAADLDIDLAIDLLQDLLDVRSLGSIINGLGKLTPEAISRMKPNQLDDLFADSVLGGAGIGLSLIEDLSRNLGLEEFSLAAGSGAIATQVIGAFRLMGDISGAVASHSSVLGTVGKAVPILGMVGGGLGMLSAVRGMSDPDANMIDSVGHFTGNGAIAVGSGVLLASAVFPPAAIVGGGLIVAGTAIEAGVWVHEHWDEIEEVGGKVVDGGKRIIDGASNLVEDLGSGLASGADAVAGGFSKLRGLLP